jgi:hypothetical protein
MRACLHPRRRSVAADKLAALEPYGAGHAHLKRVWRGRQRSWAAVGNKLALG